MCSHVPLHWHGYRNLFGTRARHACGLPARLVLLTDTDASSPPVRFVLTVQEAPKSSRRLLLTGFHLPQDRWSQFTPDPWVNGAPAIFLRQMVIALPLVE